MNIEEMKAMGIRLARARERKGWSQSEAAQKMEVARNTINNHELAQIGMSLSKLALYSKYYGVSTDYILSGKSEEYDAEALLALYKGLDKRKKKELIRIAEVVRDS